MTARGRNYNQNDEWDEKDDYNGSIYDPQYLDDDINDNLDHCRLYIKGIPKSLNEEGLRAAFAKFGTLVEVFHSSDPNKSYGLVKYETPGEAKLAMMKMNRTEPMRLQINIAYKSKNNNNNRHNRTTNGGRDGRYRNDRTNLSLGNRDREETSSVGSRLRTSLVQEDTNSENNIDEFLMEDEYGFSDMLDSNLHLELENLKLEQLKVREEQLQCKQRVILLKQAERKPMTQMSNRCILPDGKIVVRNTNERDSRDADVAFGAGAGDSRVAARQCIVCGAAADLYCAGCGITPYCTERCQRRDWQNRHMAVCHNLVRMNHEGARVTHDIPDEPRMQQAMPLRRPHGNMSNNKREMQDRDSAEARNSASGNTSKASVKPSGSNAKDDRFNSSQEKPRQPFKQRNYNQEQDHETVKATKPVSPRKDDSVNKPRAFFNKTPQTPPALQRSELIRPGVPPASNENLRASVPPASNENLRASVPPASNQNLRAFVPPASNQNLVPKTSIPEPPIVKPEAVKPQEVIPPKEVMTSAVKPASVSDVTPSRRLVPKNYLLEKLSIGDSVIMSVEASASQCRITRGDYVCLTMSEAFELAYQSLCEDFVLDCDKDEQPCKLTPGETCSYFNPEDGGWYRARCLSPSSLALLDSGKIVSVSPADKCRKLPTKYEAVPEFCAVLTSKAVEIGANLNCKIISQTSEGFKISMTNIDTNAHVGEGEVFRWLPTVEYQPVSTAIPEVERPPLTDGSRVLLVLADTLDKVFVRPADGESQREYNDVLQEVVMSAINASPLKEPPQKGQMVIAKFTDGCYYRALVRRTNVKQNKYQIEYVEYGNVEVATLENLYPCPDDCDLFSSKAQVSALKLAPHTELSTAAVQLIDQLKQEEELVLTLPDGRKSAPSGSEATLTIAKNKVNLNKKLVEMCTPEWKKIEERGGDVIETEPIMFHNIEYTTLPARGCSVEVLDISVLRGGVISGYDSDDPRAQHVFNQLTQKMADYCNSGLGREPYLPKPEELCIAQLPPYPQWFRAVFLELVSGPGSSVGKVCYLDYGNVADVPVALLRKMMPEFITGIPVLGLHIEIRNFPEDPTDEMLARAVQHMKIDDEGRGTLNVTYCKKQAEGLYIVDAPDLLKAMNG